jgi:hypothetical protein
MSKFSIRIVDDTSKAYKIAARRKKGKFKFTGFEKN